jgi:hypothetical protein
MTTITMTSPALSRQRLGTCLRQLRETSGLLLADDSRA